MNVDKTFPVLVLDRESEIHMMTLSSIAKWEAQ